MTHRWEAVASELRARVARGEHGRAGELGSEQALGDEFGVSRITVRRALTELRAEGLLTAGRGKGWRVAGTAAGDPIGWFRIAGGATGGADAELSAAILTFETIAAPPDLQGLAPGPALRVVKLVSAAGTPFDLAEITIAAPFAESLTRRDLQRSPPPRLLAAQGNVGRTDQYVTAAEATATTRPSASRPADALLIVQRTVYTPEEQAVLRTVHRHPGSCTRIELTFPTTDQTEGPPVRVFREP